MNTHRSTFQIKTVTFNLSLAEGVDIAAVQGKKYRLTLPMNSLVFDNTGGQSAWFYAVLPVQLGTGSTSVPAGIYVDDIGVHEFLGSDEGDPRKSIVSRLVYEISFASDAETFDALPLIVKGFAVATNAPSSFSLPSFTPTVDPEIEASDISGGALPQGIGFENIPGGSISDASTLNGQPASYYLNTTTVLGDLADVDATGAVEGYVLTSNGSGWVAAESQGGSGGDGNATQIQGRDVASTAPTDGQVLAWNNTASEYQPVDQSGGGGGVTSVGATAPITSSGGSTPNIGIDAASGSTAGSMSSAHFTKLEGIASGATANDSDANLKNRANHTGTQELSTISDVSATAAELNTLDGITATVTELNHTDGVTSNIQTQLNGKAASSHTHAAADVTSGVFSIARLATGTPDGTKFVRDDGTLAVPSGGGGGGTLYTAYYQDQKGEATHGGTATAGSWQVRDLTTEVFDPGNIGTLSGNEVTLAAGKYIIRAAAPASKVNKHMVRLYNVTDSALIAYGTAAYADAGVNTQDVSFVTGYLDISGSKAIRLEHYFGTTRATDGLGQRTTNGIISIYAWMEITKIG